jgi:hypothetical protein
MFYERQ